MMKVIKCSECGNVLAQEMVDANMCWECGKILDESLLDDETLGKINEQTIKQEPFLIPQIKLHMLTTGNDFSKYEIVQYKGLVSGEAVVGTGYFSDIKAGLSDLFGTESKSYSDKMKQAKKAALYDMIIESIEKGSNAIIGISYTYVTFAGSNMIGVSINGTSVNIEKL